VSEVFTNIFEKAPADDPMLLAIKDVPKATVVEEEVMDSPEDTVERAVPRPPPPPPERKGIGGFFRKLFGR
jgi:hypothetical protein